MRATLNRMIDSTIVLPDELTCIRAGEVVPVPTTLALSPKLIVFIDSTGCSSCRINDFVLYESLFAQASETGQYSILLLLSVKKNLYEGIHSLLCNVKYPFPVYLDTENSFLRSNPMIPKDPRYHVMLIDIYNRIKMVGDPTTDAATMSLFNKTLNDINVLL